MSKDTLAIPAACRGYLLPRSAHDSLIATRDQLYLLAQLTEAHTRPAGYVVVPPDSLAELFDRFGCYVDDALSAVIAHRPEPDE